MLYGITARPYPTPGGIPTDAMRVLRAGGRLGRLDYMVPPLRRRQRHPHHLISGHTGSDGLFDTFRRRLGLLAALLPEDMLARHETATTPAQIATDRQINANSATTCTTSRPTITSTTGLVCCRRITLKVANPFQTTADSWLRTMTRSPPCKRGSQGQERGHSVETALWPHYSREHVQHTSYH